MSTLQGLPANVRSTVFPITTSTTCGTPNQQQNQIQIQSSLKILNLGGTDLPIKDIRHVLNSFSNSSALKELHLGANGLRDAGITELVQAAEEGEGCCWPIGLEILDLRYNDITHVGCTALCESLQQQQQQHNNALLIKKLYLEGNQIQDEGAVALATWLKSDNCCCEEIFLGANSIGPVGAAALAECLKTNKTVSKIYLEGNSIGPSGAESFEQVLIECKGNTSLQHLFVDNNDIGKEGSKRLAKALNSATEIGDSLLEA